MNNPSSISSRASPVLQRRSMSSKLAFASDIPSTQGNFDLVNQFKFTSADILVSKWRSRVTGLSVVHLDYEAPLVKGVIAIATEIFDDSGCPHTLEHLVFMGSEKYPYKGILDRVANLSFGNGTNAWTDTDHTAYTFKTAGPQGFLQILPIYMDHILYPTITPSSFLTEVYHLNGKGEECGVVYSEMSGRQNTCDDLMDFRRRQLLFPEESGYRSDTGGRVEMLRALSDEQIRAYHASSYVPNNIQITVFGRFSKGTATLLDVINKEIEPSIVAHGQGRGQHPPGWKRPILETPSAIRKPLLNTIRTTVEFPDEDESVGNLWICFLGPAYKQFLERSALHILHQYLISNATSPLRKEYIEISSPLCTDIDWDEEAHHVAGILTIIIGSIPLEHLQNFDEKLKASFERIVQQGIDMERMSRIILRQERDLRVTLEDRKGGCFRDETIHHFLFGSEDGSEIQASMDGLGYFAQLREWSSQQWCDLLQKYYIDPARLVVRGTPSAAMVEKLDADEKQALAKRVEKLGPEGLERAAEALKEAVEHNNTPIPPDVLSAFTKPEINHISWITVQSLQEKGLGRGGRLGMDSPLAKHVACDGEEMPFFVQYDHFQSDFVTIDAYFALDKVPDRLRPYMEIYSSAFFSLPVQRKSGERLSFEDVVDRLYKDTVQYAASCTFECFRVSITVETAMYEVAVAWLRDLVYGSEFNVERLQVVVNKIRQSLPAWRRSPQDVLSALLNDHLFSEASTSRATSVLEQSKFIPDIVEQLADEPEEVTLALDEIRKHMTQPSGVRFSIRGNVLALNKPRSTLGEYFCDPLPRIPLDPVPSSCLSELGTQPAKKAFIMSVPATESTYAHHVTRGPSSYSHPDIPALRVTEALLNATEGYLWQIVRANGLAYGAHVSVGIRDGHISFYLYRASRSTTAFKDVTAFVQRLENGSIELDAAMLEEAKSSMVFSKARARKNEARASELSFHEQVLMGLEAGYGIELLKKCQAVTKEDVISILQKYFLPLFDSSSSVAFVTTSTGKAAQIAEELGELGFEVSQHTLPNEQDDDLETASSDGESEAAL